MRRFLGTLFMASIAISAARAVPPPVAVSGSDILSGREIAVSISESNKKGLVVVFMSATCPCSDSHIEELKALVRDHPGFAFVGVHSNATEEKGPSLTYFAKAKLPFAVIRDRDYKWADRFKALKTPHAFVVLPGGEVAYQGGVSNSHEFARADRKYLREALDDLERGKPVGTKIGRTLGCAIVRGEKYAW